MGLAVFTSTASAEDRIVVERDEIGGATTVVVSTRHGWLDWTDVVRGLARAAGLDDAEAVQDLDSFQVDLRQTNTQVAIRAISAATPDVKLRVSTDPMTGEPVLRIRLESDDARRRVLKLKSLLREKLANDVARFAFRIDEGWEARSADKPLVVLIHGYTSGAESLNELHSQLKERGWPCATFSYPNDGPLLESGKRLSAELRQFRERNPAQRVVLIAHSMGGLVARVAIEDPALDPANVKGLIMVCTPNHGSQWAEVPGGLDLWEFLPQLAEQSPSNAFRQSIADGLNEARWDLQPNSRFLRDLNARDRNPNVRYSLIMGTGAHCTADEMFELRNRVRESLTSSRAGRIVLPRVDSLLADFDELEKGKGDWFVSTERARLDGVCDVLILPITHWTFTQSDGNPLQQQLHDVVFERLGGFAR
jgi:pimeloyl-ACP methyl ester carboxylesterase